MQRPFLLQSSIHGLSFKEKTTHRSLLFSSLAVSFSLDTRGQRRNEKRRNRAVVSKGVFFLRPHSYLPFLQRPVEEDKTDRSPLDAQLVGFITGLLSHTSCPPFVSGYLQLVGERRHKPKDTNCAQPTSPRTGQAQMKEKQRLAEPFSGRGLASIFLLGKNAGPW